MIPKETVDLIFETVRIEEVVSDFVSLKKRGANLLGNCPFHDEKTPSFTVSPSKGIYKCFGCGKGGNPVNFIMDHEKLDYVDALKHIAKKYHIEIQEKELTPEQIASSNLRENLYVVSSFANDFFQKQLHETEEGKTIGLSYFKERSVSLEMIKKFQLGYNPDSWDSFTKVALSKKYKQSYLEKSGLSIFKEQKSFDRFKGRVMFPIHSISGRILGFGGRTLKNDAKTAKYINSPESDIYHKRKVLYGLYLGKLAIQKADNCYLVEGYTDVISMHESGIENVVATSGTALSAEQIKLISRFTKNATILFDGDSAGIKASFKGIDLILAHGLNVKVVLFPDGEDPDSYSKKVGAQGLKNFIDKESKDFLSFKIDLMSHESVNDPTKKIELIKNVAKSIAVIPDAIAREVYISDCSNQLDINESVIRQEINQLKSPSSTIAQSTIVDQNIKTESPKKHTCYHQEKNIIRFLLNYADHEITFIDKIEQISEAGNKKVIDNEIKTSVVSYILQELENEVTFSNSQFDFIYQTYRNFYKDKELPSAEYFIQHQDQKISNTAADILSNQYTLSEQWKKHGIYTETEDLQLRLAVDSALYSLKIGKLGEIIKTKRQSLNDVDEEQQMKLLSEINHLLKIKKEISKKLGRIILH